MRFALGISVHTGWATSVIVAGSLDAPHIELRRNIEILGDDQRFVFHAAAKMPIEAARHAIAAARDRAALRAGEALAQLVAGRDIAACAIVANDKPMPEPLESIVVVHPRIHLAEGCFYRDVLREVLLGLGLRVQVLAPKRLDTESSPIRALGKRVGSPWGKDERLAALGAWSSL